MIKSVYSKMAQFTLYYTPSSTPSRTVLMLIKNMDLNVELKKVNLLEKEHFTEEYLKVNPQHCVPMINDNGFYLWESRAIITYLINTRSPGHSLYPVDPKQRALIDQRLYFDAATLVPRIRAICYSAIQGNGSEIKEADREKLYDAFDLLDKFLEGKVWFAGDNVTIADLSILSSISAIKEVGANINKYSNLAGWYEKCKGLPGFDEVESGAILYRDRVRKNLVGDL